LNQGNNKIIKIVIQHSFFCSHISICFNNFWFRNKSIEVTRGTMCFKCSRCQIYLV